MNNAQTPISRKLRTGWLLLAAGVLLILIGIAIRLWFPYASVNPKWFESPGILFLGWSIFYLGRYLPAARSETTARRLQVEDRDERSQSIQRQAGFAAFVFSMLLSCVALLGYSLLTAGKPGFDALWFALAALVVLPGAFFTLYLTWLNSKR